MRMSLAITALALLSTVSLACRQREADPAAAPPAVDAGTNALADASSSGAALKPLALGCSANVECASGFCVEGVCCENACDGQCSTCSQPGSVGYCIPQIVGDDTRSAETCTGARTCALALSVLNLPPCRLKELQACTSNSDCASLLCQTFYVDHDGDGYGDSSTTLKLCEAQGATAPVGYVTQGSDCCDSDRNAYPAQNKYFTSADTCGDWDYSCDGTIQGSTGLFTLGTVPSTECGETMHGSCTSCTETIECH